MSDANLASILESTAERAGTAVAIVFGDGSVTYDELAAGARWAASALGSLGVGPGDRVGIWMGNHPSFAAVMYGAWRLGAVVVPIHAMLTEPEARHILADADTKVVVCGNEQYAKLRDEDGRATHETLRRAGSENAPPIAAVSDDDLALLPYTSGTTGFPKGAMLTHANLRANLEQMLQTPIAPNERDVNLCVLPLFHIYGLNVVLNMSVLVGAKIVLVERFDSREVLDSIRSHGVTQVAAAPAAYVDWLALEDAPADAFASVRVAVSGAAPLPGEVLKGFADRFGTTIWEGYGLTETAPALTTTAMGGVAKAGSIGRPLPGVEIRLVDEDREESEEGDPGEVVVKGPNVFRGYWNQLEETRRVLVDGWFHTGDVAIIDDDGDLYLVDRRRDLILVSGFNVYPREVEDVLRKHAKVADSAVVGMPDPRSGEAVHAFVVAAPGQSVSAEELIEFSRSYLAPYKIPSKIDLVPEIPRNAAGKVLRRVLKD